MNDFFGSKFVQDLKNGKLPPVEVKFSTESLMQIAGVVIFTAVVIIIVTKITSK